MTRSADYELMVTTYLQSVNQRLSGAAFKVAFEIATRFDGADARISVTEFQTGTGLSRNTVRSAIAEARASNAIEQIRQGGCYSYRPVFGEGQQLHSPNIAPSKNCAEQKTHTVPEQAPAPEALVDHTGLFEVWLGANKVAREFTLADRAAAESALSSFTHDNCRRAIVGAASAGFTDFAELLASPDAVEAGIILYEFMESRA